MINVDYVEINITKINESINILMDIKNNLIVVNENTKEISPEQIDSFFRIIRLWKEEYYDLKIIDSEKFTIRIIYHDTVDIIKGDGCYPENYIEFKNWVGRLYE